MLALGGLSLLAVAIPIAVVAQAAASDGNGQVGTAATAAEGLVPEERHYGDSGDEATASGEQLIGFESCTVINGLIPADPDIDGTTDLCWALEGAGDRPDECPADDEPYLFSDTNGDGIVDTCSRTEFRCELPHTRPMGAVVAPRRHSDATGDSNNDARSHRCNCDCRTTSPSAADGPTCSAATPRPRPRPAPPTPEPYWSQPG